MSKVKNPFINQHNAVPVSKYHVSRRSPDDMETIRVPMYRDMGAKVNVYIEPFSELLTSETLTPVDRIVLLHLITALKRDSDRVKLDYKILGELYGIGRTVSVTAINHLCKLGVLSKYKNGEYWINPKYFFRGSRPNHYLSQAPESEVLNVRQETP